MSLRNRTTSIRTVRRVAVLGLAVLLLAVVLVRETSSGGAPYGVTANAAAGGANAPGRGNIHENPAPAKRDADAHSALNQPVDTKKARLEITAVEALDVQSHVPGDINGPGVAITVRITNRGAGTLDLDNVTVDLIDSQGRSASPASLDGYDHLAGSFGPGKPATGRYVFTIAPADRDGAQVRITYGPPPEPTVVFAGGLPHA